MILVHNSLISCWWCNVFSSSFTLLLVGCVLSGPICLVSSELGVFEKLRSSYNSHVLPLWGICILPFEGYWTSNSFFCFNFFDWDAICHLCICHCLALLKDLSLISPEFLLVLFTFCLEFWASLVCFNFSNFQTLLYQLL